MKPIHEASSQLREAGIKFTTQDRGHHLVVTHNGLTVDFWPNSGVFVVREPPANRRLKSAAGKKGVAELIAYLTNF